MRNVMDSMVGTTARERGHGRTYGSASGGGRGAGRLRGGIQEELPPEVGRLLSVAAAAKPHGTVAESGTGSGVGTAWLHSGLGTGARLITVERDEELARRAAGLFADDRRVSVLTGDWRLLEEHAPFDVFFCDGGESVTIRRGWSNCSLPAAFSSSTTSPRRPTGRLVSTAKWMSYASSTSRIPPWTPPGC